jgi:hypothetical protein
MVIGSVCIRFILWFWSGFKDDHEGGEKTVRCEGRAHTSTLVGFLQIQVVLLPSIVKFCVELVFRYYFYA